MNGRPTSIDTITTHVMPWTWSDMADIQLFLDFVLELGMSSSIAARSSSSSQSISVLCATQQGEGEAADRQKRAHVMKTMH